MPNSITVLNPYQWTNNVQQYLNKMLIGLEICNTKIEQYLQSGSRVNFPALSQGRVQTYTQGTNLVADPMVATQSYVDINETPAVVHVMDPVQQRQAAADYGAAIAYQDAFVLKQYIDQVIIKKGIDNAHSSNLITGGTLTSSNILPKMTDSFAALQSNNALNGTPFIAIDPRREALLTQAMYNKGFVQADKTLQNGFSGSAVGFDVFVTNNLYNKVTLTMPTIPVAGTAFTLGGVTLNWVAAGAAATAGDIAIGANIAASKVNLLLMLAGTATATAATYADLSVDDRRLWQNMQLKALEAWGATSADMLTIGGFGGIRATGNGVPVADFQFGTETTSMLAGVRGAIALGIQLAPLLQITPEPLQFATNHKLLSLFGSGVFSRDVRRLSEITCNY